MQMHSYLDLLRMLTCGACSITGLCLPESIPNRPSRLKSRWQPEPLTSFLPTIRLKKELMTHNLFAVVLFLVLFFYITVSLMCVIVLISANGTTRHHHQHHGTLIHGICKILLHPCCIYYMYYYQMQSSLLRNRHQMNKNNWSLP